MNKWNVCSLFFTCLLLAACSGKKTGEQTVQSEEEPVVSEYPVTVPFESGVANEREVTLSQIADRVEYIPLETKSECLLSNIWGAIQYVDGNYVVPCSKSVWLFDGNGKYIRRIGRSGQGPGEYNYVRFLDTDYDQGLIYLVTSAKILVYSTAGEFQRSIPFLLDPIQAAVLNDSTIASFVYNSSGQEKECVILSNQKGEKLKGFPRYDLFTTDGKMSFSMRGANDRYLSHYDTDLYYKDFYNDTLYTVTEKELHPRYIIQLGKYAIPVETRWETSNGDRKKFERNAAPYLRVNVFETDSYLLMPYTHWAGEKENLEEMVMYDKKNKTCFKVADGTVRNDMEGGLPFIPYTSVGDNLLVSVWSVSEIWEKAEKDPSILEHPQLKGLKEDDNPVLMVVHLR